ncbi:hypothetical protein V500_05184 [Pseudogymnoascus sp. VKM F-4518 (FW-2643)]|nr:hypothetical protein V500_05184 [Pseudogymnoascus sp. VKM F-4518 (FW-2643)]
MRKASTTSVWPAHNDDDYKFRGIKIPAFTTTEYQNYNIQPFLNRISNSLRGIMALSRQEVADIFLDAESRKLTHLARAAINQDGFLDDKWMQEQCDLAGYTILNTAYQILLEIPTSVLRAIIRGDLPEISHEADVRALQSPKYVAAPSNLFAKACIFPSIYTIYFVNKTTNEPPTIADILQLIAYLVGNSNNPAVLNLARDLKERIRGCSPQDTLAGGLVDVGFSGDGALRLTQHYANVSSNDVMQQFKSASVMLFGQSKYVIRGFIVCRLQKFNYCSLAEVILSRLAQSYTSRGGGFNGVAAGASITGARNLSPSAWEQIGAVEATEIYKKNLAADQERLQELRDIAERQKNLAIERALQDTLVGLLPQEEQDKIRAAGAALREALYTEHEERHRDSEEEDAADEDVVDDEAESVDEEAAGEYSSDIEFSSSPTRGNPAPRN